MKKTLISVSVALFTTLLLNATSFADHVDFMSDAGFIINASSVSGVVSDSQIGAGGNILGSERDISLNVIDGKGLITVGLLLPDGPGPVGPNDDVSVSFSNSVGTRGEFELNYDGIGGVGLGGVNFASNWNSVALDFGMVQGSGDVTLEFEDTLGNFGSATQTVDNSGVYSYLFADGAYSGIDFTAIDRVTFTLDTNAAASDFSLRSIRRSVVTIPEPTTTGVAALVCLGMSVVRRRRR